MTFENFDILLRDEGNDVYTVSASYDDRGGKAESSPVTFNFDADEPEFANLYKYLEAQVADRNDITTLGKKMYSLLFPPQVQNLYTQLETKMQAEDRGVRIRLNIASTRPQDNTFSSLIHLPWEYCYNSTHQRFMGTARTSPIVRYVPRPFTPESLATSDKLRILLVLSNPTDVTPLNVEKEEQIMRDALGDKIGDTIELEVLKNVTQLRLYRKVNDFDPHVIHFVGHGTYEDGEGALIIETDEQTQRKLTAQQFSDLVEGLSVRAVVLNACDTSAADAGAKAFNSTAVGLVYARIPAVISMQFRVPDNIALQFTDTLYWHIAKGTPIDQAVSEMRKQVSLGSTPEENVLWGVPTLYMRAPDGQLWGSDEREDRNASDDDDDDQLNQATSTVINIGSSKGNIALGDLVFGGITNASDNYTTTEIYGGSNTYGRDYLGYQMKEPSLVELIEKIQKDVKPLLGQLDEDDSADVTDNLEEAHESASSATPKGKRISRKLGNALEVLEDNDLDDGLIDQLEVAIKKAKKL